MPGLLLVVLRSSGMRSGGVAVTGAIGAVRMRYRRLAGQRMAFARGKGEREDGSGKSGKSDHKARGRYRAKAGCQ
ncbi:MAG: hypothetical protein ABMA13_19445 [Chthoniobacteraceae bacterium]